MSETLHPLLDKLQRAKFTGELKVRFESGQVASAELIHFLANEEFQSRALPTVEKEFELKA